MRTAAHQLLDRVRAGERVHPDAITAALHATGDIAPGDDEPLQLIRESGTWERRHLAAMGPASWLDAIAPFHPCDVGLHSAA
jgi:antitoxin (DNA-binding transcriptional repressor) of toxin-antitoxin stability system